MESISLGKSKNIGVILISKNIFKALAKKPSAMKAIIVGGIAVIAVPTTIFGYATQKSDVVEEASTIVEVDSVSDDTVDTTKAIVTSVDDNIADVLNIEKAPKVAENSVNIGGLALNGSLEKYMTGIESTAVGVDKAIKGLDLKSKAKTTTTESTTATETAQAETTETTTKPAETTAPPVEEKAEPVTETKQEEVPQETEPAREYVVFKPSTHYVHKNTCRWADGSCYEITSTEGIEARRCTECNADIAIVTEYIEPIPETPTYAIDDYSRQLLAEIVWHEAGSNWISQYNKAKVAAGVMNRVNDSRFPSTVYTVLTQPGQFSGYWPGCCTPTQDCYDAVDYYFSHTSEFNGDNSWWGDGSQNHFYYQ